MKKFLKIIVLFLVTNIMLLGVIHVSQATDESPWILPEKSKEFEKWENLPEEERKNTRMPSYSNITYKESIKRSHYNLLQRRLAKDLEASYKRNGLTVKNQQATGLCWAFSFSSVLEGSGTGKIYSPAYLDYIVSSNYNKSQGNGANSFVAMGGSTSGQYPILESKMPFNSVYKEDTNEPETFYLTPKENLPEGTLNQKIDARITHSTRFASIYKQIDENGNITYDDGVNNQYTEAEVIQMRNVIKEHLRNEGPITATIYSDLGLDQDGNVVSANGFCNTNTWAHFCNDSSKTVNHAVTIVGWDDNYSISNFNQTKAPKTQGAYIVLNSYGEEVGDNGYIYVSYEDLFIEEALLGLNELEEYETAEQIPYDTLYQYDELGDTSYSISSDKINLMAANVFSKQSTENEYLNEVGIFLPQTEGVQIYVNATSGDLTNLKQVAVETNTITPGYHIISLANPIKLTGDKFAVAVKYINQEDGSMIPLECNWRKSNITFIPNYYDKATSNPGESFVSADNGNTWEDMDGLQLSYMITLKDTNACIKAYTTKTSKVPETIDVTGITLNKNSINLNIGQTENLTATIMPTNATNQNIRWESLNPNIATVSNGVITGISAGTTTIKVTTEDGNYMANCQVTVKPKEPENILVTGVQLNKTAMTLEVGKTEQLIAKVLPDNATNKNIKWESANPQIATIVNGVVTAVSKGTTTIKVTTVDGNYMANCQVTVQEKEPSSEVAVSEIKLNQEKLSLEVGDKGNLVATIKPTNATNQEVNWTSSNPKVATISEEGVITAIAEGTTTIKVTTLDGKFSATCLLTVVAKKNTEDDIYQENPTTPPSADSGSVKNENEDTTIANKTIPFAGSTWIMISLIIGIVGIAIFAYVKVRLLKDVK